MINITGDEAVLYKKEGNKTIGIIVLHVDDIMATGSEEFFNTVISNIKNKFRFSKLENDKFRFTGIDVEFKKHQTAITSGQFLALYHENQLIASSVIP